jgi:signal peptidase I
MSHIFSDDDNKINEEIEKPEKSIFKTVLEYVVTLAIIVAAIFVIQAFVIVNARIPSASMENTIMTGERLFGNRLAYLFGEPERYDIIIFKYPDDESQLFIKRIIGLPGETVIISGGEVYAVDCYTDTTGVSDEELIEDPMMFEDTIMLDDSFIKEPMNEDEGLVFRVPDDEFFVLGDNRNNSSDSRYWDDHFVSRDEILGEALLRYWPFNKISLLGYNGDAQ